MYSGVNTFVWRKFDIPANQQPMKLPDGLQVFQVPSKGEGLQTLNPIHQGTYNHSLHWLKNVCNLIQEK